MEKEEYIITWRSKWITAKASNIDDFISVFEELAKMFRRWKEAGIKLDLDSGFGDDYADFYTDDKEVAIREGSACLDEDGRELLELRSGGHIFL
ncbi:MAG: hypothetical protein ACFE9I_18230 [Candidatus Hermodarchaeota archaeon]